MRPIRAYKLESGDEMKKGKLLVFIIIYALYLNVLFLASDTQNAQAVTFTGGFATGNLTYGVSSGSVSIAETSASQWNGKSTKAKLTYSTEKNQYGSTAKIVTHFNSQKPPTSGALGIMYPYKSWTGTSANSATTSERWVKAIVYQYNSTLLNNDTKRIATATHEFGHALSVAHAPISNTTAVMRQGVKTSYKLTSYDINSLKDKWGK